MDLTKL
jgi:hypothetical protein